MGLGRNRFIFGDIKDQNMFAKFYHSFKIQPFWFPAGQNLKKGDFSTFLKGR